jgi:antitoxin component of MazEF toxin-antitoxin module
MLSRIRKVGNSHMITIPCNFFDLKNLKKGQWIEWEIKEIVKKEG